MGYKLNGFNDLSGSDVFRKSRGQSVSTLLYSPEQLADALGCSVAMVRKQLMLKTVQAVKLGALVRIPLAEVERIAAEGFVPPLVTVGAYEVGIYDADGNRVSLF
jgi:hypothetical protein